MSLKFIKKILKYIIVTSPKNLIHKNMNIKLKTYKHQIYSCIKNLNVKLKDCKKQKVYILYILALKQYFIINIKKNVLRIISMKPIANIIQSLMYKDRGFMHLDFIKFYTKTLKH